MECCIWNKHSDNQSNLEFYYFCETNFGLIRKYFPLDKNYLLEQAQLQLMRHLLPALLDKAKKSYEFHHNPLGLTDTFTARIRKFVPKDFKSLEEFYFILAGIYRFRYGTNQLELLWDGTDHLEKYSKDWTEFFYKSVDQFCADQLFVQAVLDLTVFLPENDQPVLSGARMQNFILNRFKIKISKQSGYLAA